jgi:hypothetical protein
MDYGTYVENKHGIPRTYMVLRVHAEDGIRPTSHGYHQRKAGYVDIIGDDGMVWDNVHPDCLRVIPKETLF